MNRARLGGFFGRGIVPLSVTSWFVRSFWHPGRIYHVGTRQGEPAPVYGHGLGKTVYERHQPEQRLLYQLVEAHYPALVSQLSQQGKSLPDHVHREFEAYLKCGRLEYGFLRVRCDKCHFERLVAFSCKKRGFRPSCGARRMAETAALLAEEVFPDVPLRQWVISFPFPLRYLFTAHPQAMGKVLGVIYRAISTHLIHKAGYRLRDSATGAVTLIQRFGSALNLNIHFHILFLDGVYAYRDKPRFQRVKAPDKGELEDLVQLISKRVGRCLERQGLLEQDTESAWLDLDPAEDTDAMPQILGSSVSYRIAVGPQQGRKAFMIRTIRPLDRPDPALERVAKANGFSLHAGVSCEGHQKDKRERLCRYIARPAVAVPRLSLSSTGRVLYTLKTPYRDGTTQVAFDPVDFIARLAALARARSDQNPGSTSPATMVFLLGAAIRLITDGADWSHQPNAEKASSLSPMRKSAQPLSDIRQ